MSCLRPEVINLYETSQQVDACPQPFSPAKTQKWGFVTRAKQWEESKGVEGEEDSTSEKKPVTTFKF